MAITQTIEIPESRRLVLDVPSEVPVGMTTIMFIPMSSAPVAANKGKEIMTEAEESEHTNLNAERLNREAMDVLSYQCWPSSDPFAPGELCFLEWFPEEPASPGAKVPSKPV